MKLPMAIFVNPSCGRYDDTRDSFFPDCWFVPLFEGTPFGVVSKGHRTDFIRCSEWGKGPSMGLGPGGLRFEPQRCSGNLRVICAGDLASQRANEQMEGFHTAASGRFFVCLSVLPRLPLRAMVRAGRTGSKNPRRPREGKPKVHAEARVIVNTVRQARAHDYFVPRNQERSKPLSSLAGWIV